MATDAGDRVTGEDTSSRGPLGTDPRDIAGLYVRHRHELAVLAHRYLYSPYDVDEVVQEAFLRLVLSMPELETEPQAVAYARRTVTNLCFDRIRRAKRAPAQTPLDEMPVEPPSDDGALEDPILAAEDAFLVRQALAKLAPTQRQALIAYEVEEKPVPQIAAELGIEESAVKHVLYRARRTLRKLLVGSSADPSVDLLSLESSEVWTIAGQRAARGASRLGALLLLLAIPALAVLALLSTRGGDEAVRIAEPPIEVGGGLLDPVPGVGTGTPTPELSQPERPAGTSAPTSSSDETPAGNSPDDESSSSSAAPPPAGTTSPSASTSEEAPSPRPTPTGPASATRPTPSNSSSPSPTQTSSSPTTGTPTAPLGPSIQGFTVGGALSEGSARAGVVADLAPGDGDTSVSFLANTRVGPVSVDVSIEGTGDSLRVDAVPTLPISGSLVRFDPVEVATSQVTTAAGDTLLNVRMTLSGAGVVVGRSGASGLAAGPKVAQLSLLMSPDLGDVESARLEVLELSAPAPSASPSTTTTTPKPSVSSTAATPTPVTSPSATATESLTPSPPADAPSTTAAPTAPVSANPGVTGTTSPADSSVNQ